MYFEVSTSIGRFISQTNFNIKEIPELEKK